VVSMSLWPINFCTVTMSQLAAMLSQVRLFRSRYAEFRVPDGHSAYSSRAAWHAAPADTRHPSSERRPQ
jgi:hypothetical protein